MAKNLEWKHRAQLRILTAIATLPLRDGKYATAPNIIRKTGRTNISRSLEQYVHYRYISKKPFTREQKAHRSKGKKGSSFYYELTKKGERRRLQLRNELPNLNPDEPYRKPEVKK